MKNTQQFKNLNLIRIMDSKIDEGVKIDVNAIGDQWKQFII